MYDENLGHSRAARASIAVYIPFRLGDDVLRQCLEIASWYLEFPWQSAAVTVLVP